MLDEKIRKLFTDKLAKPDESLEFHTEYVIYQSEILNQLGYIKNENTQRVLKLACTYHDLGKINYFFRERVKHKLKFNPEVEMGHNILSVYLLNLFYEMEFDKNYDEWLLLSNSILNHHRYVPNYDVLYFKKDLINKNLRKINEEDLHINEEIFEEKIINIIGVEESIDLKEMRNDLDYILIKGLLHKCDYSASAHIDCEIKNDFLYEKLNDLGYSWREIQQYCLDNSEENLIIIGSTGLGKTEASLLWGGDNKIFYVLPLRTAINAMYKRFTEIIGSEYQDKVGLLHGETASVYLSETTVNEEMLKESEKFYDYYYKTKNMSLPITVATPDQLFDFVFKYPGYELKLATFSYSKIIIDEIQAYSPDILAYTIHAIKRINTLGGKFSILTATLAPFVKDLLLRHEDDEKEIEFKEEVFLTDKVRHNLSIEERPISAEFIFNVLNKRQDINTCLIVVNTITEAQEMYYAFDELARDFDIEVDILHSKFTIGDRRLKEVKILEDGRKANQNEEKLKIWISTQIVEASLDIDFDIIFTELSELLGLFQRLGRCYRQRNLSSDNPNVYVFTEINEKILTTSKYGFIDAGLYEISKNALLKKGDGLITEKQKIEMIDKHYTTERLKSTENSKYLEQYNNKYNYIKNLNIDELDYSKVKEMFRNIISFKSIPESVYINNNYEITEIVEEIRKTESEISSTDDKTMKGKLRINLLGLKDKINEFTISVQPYLVDFRNYIEVSNEKIYIVSYKYSKAGLEKEKDEENIFLW